MTNATPPQTTPPPQTAETKKAAKPRSITTLKKLVVMKAIEAGRAYEAYSHAYETCHQQYNAPLLPEVDAACKASNRAEAELRELNRELARALAAVSR